jgi:histone H3/H4
MSDINIPKSMLKKFLSSKGMRVKPASIKTFENKFISWANEVVTKATNRAEENKRKTIMPEDLE